MNKNAFSLIELIMVSVLMMIVFTVAFRSIGNTIDVKRFQATINEMVEIRKALVGDENLIDGQSRLDFGYVGDNGSFPSPSGGKLPQADLASYFEGGIDFRLDGWGNAYAYSTGATITITSYGADGSSGGSGLDEDIVLSFSSAKYLSNTVSSMCYDVRGNILTGNDTAAAISDNHIQSLIFQAADGTNYTAVCTNSVFVISNIPIGEYTVLLTVANNSGSGGTNWRTLINEGRTLLNDGNVTAEVYPKGSICINLINFRLPGAVTTES